MIHNLWNIVKILSEKTFEYKRLWLIFCCVLLWAMGCRNHLTHAAASQGEREQSALSFIDTHSHLDGVYRLGGVWESDYDAAARTAMTTMDEAGVQKSLLLPPPFPPHYPRRYDYSVLAEVVKNYPDRFSFLGGGGLLNPMIHAVPADQVTTEIRQEFEAKATEIIAAGAAGFGEMTALHLSFFENHPFLEGPPDHPLFLLLSDIAARADMPIDLHMEAVTQDINLPTGFSTPPNPSVLHENIKAFERLLAHNRKARIVWAHVGWDNTGHMTVSLLRRLLHQHSNLFMSIKILTGVGRQIVANRPLQEDGSIRPEWLELIHDFPDRFVIGSDQFYGIPGLTPGRPQSATASWSLIDQLPEELASKMARENALQIYRIK